MSALFIVFLLGTQVPQVQGGPLPGILPKGWNVKPPLQVPIVTRPVETSVKVRPFLGTELPR